MSLHNFTCLRNFYFSNKPQEKRKLPLKNAGRDEPKKRIADMGTFLREQPTALAEYNEPLVRWLIEKVTCLQSRLTVVYNKFTMEWGFGVMVDVHE